MAVIQPMNPPSAAIAVIHSPGPISAFHTKRKQKPVEKLTQSHARFLCMVLRQLLDGLKRSNRVTHSAEERPRLYERQAQLTKYILIVPAFDEIVNGEIELFFQMRESGKNPIDFGLKSS